MPAADVAETTVHAERTGVCRAWNVDSQQCGHG
jgi:hypothetical protein